MAVRRGGNTLAELLQGVELFPQTLVNVRLASLAGWQDNPTLASELCSVEAEMGEGGRTLIRASGTEPVLRVMVEARDASVARAAAQRLARAAQAGPAASA
jgi:phosphoglucosamine mutase